MTLKVGVSGAGNIATGRHIPAYQNHENTEVIGVFDTSESRKNAAAANFDIQPVSTYDDLCSQADLISNCTPPWVHCSQTIRALESGCHVLTEKPMAMSSEEGQRMVNAAAENDRILSVVHNLLFMRAIDKARNIVASGDIGDVTRTYMPMLLRVGELTERHGPRWFDMPGGVFWDEAPHMMYITQDFIGSLDVVDTAVGTWDNIQEYDSVRVTFEGNSGKMGQISVLYDTPMTEWWFVVVGTDGIIFVDIFRETLIKFDRESAHSASRVLEVLIQGLWQAGLGGFLTGISTIKDRLIDGYKVPSSGFPKQVDGVINAIQEGTQPPIPGEEGKVILGGMVDVGKRAGFTFQEIE